MSAPSKFTAAKWAAYLLPVAKAVFLGQLDLKDGLLNDIVESGIDLLGDDAKEKLTAFLKTKPDAVRDVLDQHLIRHQGAVLGRMVRRYAEEQTMEKYRPLLFEVADEVPAAWIKYHALEEASIETLRGDLFTQLALGVLVPGALASQHDTTAIIAFFRWAAVEQNMLGPLMPGLTPAMAEWIAQNVSRQLLIDLCQDTKEGNAAWKESMLRLSVETHGKLDRMEHNQAITAAHAFGAHQGIQVVQQQGDLILGQLADALKANSAETRLNAYKRSLLNAFSAYQELALDNYAAADQASPEIWDIFVHPACSQKHLRPEDMDAAQMESPLRMPASDLLPLLAQDDHRRTVLLADPGMGKSTLIQSLIAHLASGRPLAGASALSGLLPVPLILRDLVPLLPQDQVESWRWDSLITVLLEHYKRDETSSPLCEAYQGHETEFRQLIHSSDQVFFLIDGLDEIGDLVKRRKIVKCIQDGIRATNKNARWLITSRVIGYDDAPVNLIKGRCYSSSVALERERRLNPHSHVLTNDQVKGLVWEWIERLKVGNKLEVSKIGREGNWLFGQGGHEVNETEFDGPLGMRTRSETIIPTELQSSVFHGALGGTEKELRDPMSASAFYRSGPIYANIGPGGLVVGYHFELQIAQCLYLAPFDNSRQDAFTSCWFRHRHSTDHSRELMREVRAHHHDGVRIISRVPNLLCMMNMLKRSGKPLPDGRAALYDEIVKAYLGGIDSAYKLKPIHGHNCPFETTERRHLLSLLGAYMQQQRTRGSQQQVGKGKEPQTEVKQESEGHILISVPEIQMLLIPAIESMQQAGKVKRDHSAGELLNELLHHIASRSGLLIPRSTDVSGNTVYGFTHLSFLEFFAAEWLGKEFDRQRNRIVRQSLAAMEGQSLTDADLDHEFPAQGPVQHSLNSFKLLPAILVWHEPLIFLLESRKSDAPTLLRWLFPALHNQQPHVVQKDDETAQPLLPLEAVQLAVNLAQDPEIPLPVATRQEWWRILWSAYLIWPYPPSIYSDGPRYWPIAPLLLQKLETQAEVISCLIEAHLQWPNSTVYLSGCTTITNSSLESLKSLTHLNELWLNDCSQLTDTDGLAGLTNLKSLFLNGCTGLKEPKALSGLKGLTKLERLWLYRCEGITDTTALVELKRLKSLSLGGCTSLKEKTWMECFRELGGLEVLFLHDCPDLEDTSFLKHLPKLQRLNLSNCYGLVNSDSLDGILGLHDLQELSLRGCIGLECVPELGHLRNLKVLDLDDCPNLKDVQALSSLTALTSLHLSRCPKLKSLPDLTPLNQLRSLYLFQSKGVRNVRKLKTQLHPNCKITGP